MSAIIISDSINWTGHRLTTVQYKAPRCILAEINTHRVFSRNARSSRAVPTSRITDEILDNSFVPDFRLNQRGMVAKSDKIEDELFCACLDLWRDAMFPAIDSALGLEKLGIHKQYQNRLLEPFSFVHGVITATEWDNFFFQRLKDDAEPSMRALAQEVMDAMKGSIPKELQVGEWHLPYIEYDEKSLDLDVQKKVSVARNARVSITPFDSEKKDTEKDLALYDFLFRSGHVSPFEHVARVPSHFETVAEAFSGFWQLLLTQQVKTRYANFSGWIQYRQEI